MFRLRRPQITELLAEEQKLNSGLRVFVQGGCSLPVNLMIEERRIRDQCRITRDSSVDQISIRYLKGAEVDFVDTVTGGGFTIRTRTPSPRAAAALVHGGRRSGGPRARPQPLTRFLDGGACAPPSEPDIASGRKALQQARSDRQGLPEAGGHSAPMTWWISCATRITGSAARPCTPSSGWSMRIARKVDFGEGHFRLSIHAPPAAFPSICKTATNVEFLSSDIEA